MRSKLFCALLALVCTVQVHAQADTVVTVPRPRATLHAYGGYDSPVLRNDLLRRMVEGGYIDRDLRERTAVGLNAVNRAGLGARASFTYHWQWRETPGSWTPHIAIATQVHGGIRFAPTLYRTAMFGNADQQERVLDLAPVDYLWTNYRTIGFGFDHRSGGHLRLAYVDGLQLVKGQLAQAALYTAAYGERISGHVTGEHSSTGSSAGNGAGLAFSGAWPVWTKGADMRRWQALIGVQDLGFVHWNRDVDHVAHNGPVSYTGLYVEDLWNVDDLALDGPAILAEAGLELTHAAMTNWLPTRFHAELVQGRDHYRARYAFMVEHRLLPGYLPRIEALYRYGTVSGRLMPELALSYGGYGGLRAGLGISGGGEKLRFRLHVPTITGVVAKGAQGTAVLFGVDLLR